MDIPLDELQSDFIRNKLIMSFLIHEEMKTDHQKEKRELNRALRHCFYVRNRNAPLTPEAMDSLEFSIQEHMAKFKVEFEARDEKIHITLPDEDLLGLIRLHQELRDHLHITKISTFFRLDPERTF